MSWPTINAQVSCAGSEFDLAFGQDGPLRYLDGIAVFPHASNEGHEMLPSSPPDGNSQTIGAAPGVLAIASLALAVWLMRWAALGLQAPAGDGVTYLDMARGEEGDPPHFFHILAPRLAGLFPDPLNGLFFIAASCFIGTSVAVALLLRHPCFRATFLETILGVALFMTTYVGIGMFRGYFLNDSLSYFLLAVACAATLYRRDEIVAIATMIGLFNRETALFVMPVWMLSRIGSYALGQVALRFVLVFVPALIAYLILHHTSIFFGRYPDRFDFLSPQTIKALWTSNISWLGTPNVAVGLLLCVGLSYGPVWLVSAWGYRWAAVGNDQSLRRALIALGSLVLPVGASLLVVDWRRGFQPLFPAIIPSAVIGVRTITGGLPRPYWYIFSAGTVLGTGLTVESWWMSPMRIPIAIGVSVWLGSLGSVLIVRWNQPLKATRA